MKNKKQYEWDKKNTYRLNIKLNNNNDKDIIELLKTQNNKQAFIKKLLKNYLDNR